MDTWDRSPATSIQAPPPKWGYDDKRTSQKTKEKERERDRDRGRERDRKKNNSASYLTHRRKEKEREGDKVIHFYFCRLGKLLFYC